MAVRRHERHRHRSALRQRHNQQRRGLQVPAPPARSGRHAHPGQQLQLRPLHPRRRHAAHRLHRHARHIRQQLHLLQRGLQRIRQRTRTALLRQRRAHCRSAGQYAFPLRRRRGKQRDRRPRPARRTGGSASQLRPAHRQPGHPHRRRRSAASERRHTVCQCSDHPRQHRTERRLACRQRGHHGRQPLCLEQRQSVGHGPAHAGRHLDHRIHQCLQGHIARDTRQRQSDGGRPERLCTAPERHASVGRVRRQSGAGKRRPHHPHHHRSHRQRWPAGQAWTDRTGAGNAADQHRRAADRGGRADRKRLPHQRRPDHASERSDPGHRHPSAEQRQHRRQRHDQHGQRHPEQCRAAAAGQQYQRRYADHRGQRPATRNGHAGCRRAWQRAGPAGSSSGQRHDCAGWQSGHHARQRRNARRAGPLHRSVMHRRRLPVGQLRQH